MEIIKLSGEGWITLNREIWKHWIWSNPVYFRAWVYCILRANHEPAKLLIDSELKDIKRGQFITSIKNFGSDTGMTRSQVATFWKLLESDKMIVRKATSKMTRITVCNYERYQGRSETNRKPIGNQSETNRKPIGTDNNVNNVNNDNKKGKPARAYREFKHLKLSKSEYDKLIADGFTKTEIDDNLDAIENFKKNTNYTSLNLTVRNWIKRDRKRDGVTKPGVQADGRQPDQSDFSTVGKDSIRL